MSCAKKRPAKRQAAAGHSTVTREVSIKSGVDDYSFVPQQLIAAGFKLTMLKEEEVKKARRIIDAMAQALRSHLPATCRWELPQGGMFFWVQLPAGCDASALLPKAVARGMAFVPGSAFFAEGASESSLRLSFVTATPEQIDLGVRMLAETLKEAS